MKKCTKCKVTKPLEKYGVDKTTKDGYRYSCKDCYNKQQREYAKNNKEKIRERNARKKESRKAYYQSEQGIKSSRNSHLKRNFGITLDEYENLSKKQNHVCKICGGKETQYRNRVLSVDHNHTTGEIRGLLCSNCNRALGLFKDKIENLINAVKYLKNE